MGLLKISALEIFTNPRDLLISIGQSRQSGKYALAICRGPGHNFKPIVTSSAIFDTADMAITEMGKILEIIRQSCLQDLGDEETITSRVLNPDDEEIDESKILTPELIEQIIKQLQQKQVAGTYEMPLAG